MYKELSGLVYIVVIDGDTETTFSCENMEHGFPVSISTDNYAEIFAAIDALLQLVEHVLPTSATGFEVSKAKRLLKKESQMLADRMKVIAEPNDDELPF